MFFRAGGLPAAALAKLLLVIVLTHAGALGGAWALSGAQSLKLCAADRAAFLFCASQKTVILGVPLIHGVFRGRSPDALALLVLPLTLYHVLELVVGLLVLAPRLGEAVGRALALETEGAVLVTRT